MRPIRADEVSPRAGDGLPRQILGAQNARPLRVVDVVIDVSGQIGHADNLSFEGLGPLGRRHADRRSPFAFGMMRDAVAHFPGQVQALPIVLEHVDDAQALLVVIEPAGDELVEHALARMPERRVAEIVAKRDRLGELLVKLQHLGDGPRNLRHLERVSEPRSIVVARRREKYLGLVLEPAERLRVHDAIAIALKRRTDIVFRLLAQPSARLGALRRLRRQDLPLARFQVFTDAGHMLLAD